MFELGPARSVLLAVVLLATGSSDPASAASAPPTRASSLEVVTVSSLERHVVYRAPGRMESPQFSPDGRQLYFNQGGHIFRLEIGSNASPTIIDTGFATRCNNDHGLSPDGTQLAISDLTATGKSLMYLVPITGGRPKRVNVADPAYWHSWSPDGRSLAYCAARDGNYDVYTIPAGGGQEVRLTTDPGNDNGPDYSADGTWIYYHSVRAAQVQVWRMHPDGSDKAQVTHDGFYNWFPHPSPDGKWIAVLSSKQAPQTGHPPDGRYVLRLFPTAGAGGPREIASFYGGNGSLNVPSWSRDSTRIAFASFESQTGMAPETSAQVAPANTNGYPRDAATIGKGQALFAQNCAACHALAQDTMGPPLGGVTTVLTEARLMEWIHDPTKVIASGDRRAIALLTRYKAPMPAFPQLEKKDIAAILAFIDQQSAEQHLKPFAVDLNASRGPRLVPPVQKTNLVIELEDYVQVPRLPGRTAYKGITLLRPDPRERGALLVDELMGILYRIKDRQLSVFLDLRGRFPDFICDPGVASGLGSFALHPDFVHNGIFYTTHSEKYRGRRVINPNDIPADLPPNPSPRLEWVLDEWHLTDLDSPTFVGTHREVLRFVTPTTAHGSQEIAFAPVTDPRDPDYAKLYIGIGDGGSANLKRPDLAGHPRSLFGTILRIDPAGHNGVNGQYGIPADNPFAPSTDPRIHREIWAYGFRNPHRMSWDSAHKTRMIAVDIGESNIEEVNLIEKGGCYGWGVGGLEGTAHIDVRIDAKVIRAATPAELAGYHLPFGEYDHDEGTAVTGGYVYHGPLAPLQNKYIFGDIVNGRLFYMNMGASLNDHTIHEINIVRDGAMTGVKALGHLDRAHLRIGYDERTGNLYLMTKGDGMIRRVKAAYYR